MPLHFTPGAYGERFVVRDGDASGAHQFQNREERSHGLAAPPLLDEQLAKPPDTACHQAAQHMYDT